MADSTPVTIRVNGREYPAGDGRDVTVGRHPDSDVVLSHPAVSGHHAVIRLEAEGVVVRDVGSTNGTFVDGARVPGWVIAGRARIMLGHPTDGEALEIEVVSGAQPAAAQPAGGAPSAPAPPGMDMEPSGTTARHWLPSQDQGPPPGGATVVRPAVAAGAAPPPPAPVQLGPPAEIYTPTGEGLRVGRAPDNDIVLTDDLTVSRYHAVIARSPDGSFEIQDAGSANGTFLNGQRIQRATVSEGDVISISRHLFRFHQGRLEEYEDTGQVYLEAVGLSVVTEEGKTILDDVSFSLGPSSLLAIVGPSGAGKSTLTNSLNGFRPATSGAVLYAGRSLYQSYDDLRQRIGYVPQDDILHPQLKVRQALEFAAQLRFPPDVSKEERSRRIEEVLGELGLTERADLPINRLSGGQRKRVSVALELLTKPSLLFLDEPTSGLDPGNERQLMALLNDLAKGGRTVIVVTHSTQSLHLCDRVLFMAPGGKVAFYGPPDEALDYFNGLGAGEAYADVFTALEEDKSRDWGASFRASEAYRAYVGTPLEQAARRGQRAAPPVPPPRSQSWARQFRILTRRYLALIVSDRRYLLLLLLQAPVLGVVLLMMFGPRRLSIAHGAEALVIMLALVLAATWLGILNAVQEIVKELPIYRRERAVGLSISAYLSSKVAVLGVFTILQAVVMVGIGLARQTIFEIQPGLSGNPLDVVEVPGGEGAFLSNAKLELMVDVALTGLAAMALGLLVSALSRNPDKALTLVPILIVPQLVLSGGFFPVSAPVIGQLSLVASAQWGMSASASTIDLNQIRSRIIAVAIFAANIELATTNEAAFQRKFEREFAEQQITSWRHTSGRWLLNAFLLLVLTVAAVVGAYLVLRRRDERVLDAPARAGPAAVVSGQFTAPPPVPAVR